MKNNQRVRYEHGEKLHRDWMMICVKIWQKLLSKMSFVTYLKRKLMRLKTEVLSGSGWSHQI